MVGKVPVKVITAYRRKKDEQIKYKRNNCLRKQQMYLVHHNNSTQCYVKTAEDKKIENAFQHEAIVQMK
jgi:hypothetical protein